MGKKLIGIAVIAIMLFGIFGLMACDNVSLADYKEKGKASIDAHVATKTESDNWAVICSIAESGKTAVNKATTKPQVDDVVDKTKKSMDMEILEVEVHDMIELHTWLFTSGIPNNAIKVMHSEQNATFECSVDNGLFWDYESQKNTQKTTLRMNDTIYWHAWEENTQQSVEHAFAVIVLKIDANITGYAVVEISQNKSPIDHTAVVLKSAIFPKVDGNYQHITDENIAIIIEKVKQINLQKKI